MSPGRLKKEMLHYIFSYALAQLSWMVMASGRMKFDDLLPPGLTNGVFANVRSTQDFISLLIDALPFLDPGAFCVAPTAFDLVS